MSGVGMGAQTPKTISKTIQEFCHEVAPGQQPVYLHVTPVGSFSIPLDCFENVTKIIKEKGGSGLCGWRIWEWPNTMIEAEFHEVWVSPEGELVDTTPAPKGLTRILFLPDPTNIYTGLQVNSIRKSLIDNPLMREFIDNCDREFAILNKGARARVVGEVRVSLREAKSLDALRIRRFTIQRMLEPCRCGSGVRFYKCCGSE
jgi:hypothetical protein